jgi:glycosyltransferase involved in cell wall biosynthesis
MRILVNATNIVVGGGIQVAVSYISKAMEDVNGHDFIFAVSRQVKENLNQTHQDDNRLKVFIPSPSGLLSGRNTRKKLRNIELIFVPDVVFTVFGPAYVNFKAPHLCGFAAGWTTHRSKIAINALPIARRIWTIALAKYRRLRLSVTNYYWVEAEVAKRGLVRLLGIESSKIRVIKNTYAEVFINAKDDPQKNNGNGEVKIFCLAAPYPHKNLTIIPEVIDLLNKKRLNRKYKFIVTLPKLGSEVNSFWKKANKYKVTGSIKNLGPLKLAECPHWYTVADIVFLPTLLETFSATYPEAMVMGKPIVTTDLDFAHDTCGDAAAYFEPLDPQSAADAIENLANDQIACKTLVKNGYSRLAHFPDPSEKYQLIMDWLSTIVLSQEK